MDTIYGRGDTISMGFMFNRFSLYLMHGFVSRVRISTTSCVQLELIKPETMWQNLYEITIYFKSIIWCFQSNCLLFSFFFHFFFLKNKSVSIEFWQTFTWHRWNFIFVSCSACIGCCIDQIVGDFGDDTGCVYCR